MRTLVIGAGLAGLVAARDRTRAGDDVEVWEAADGPGGNIRSVTLGSVRVDVGAEAFMASAGPVAELVTELGLDLETPPAGGSHVWSPELGRPVPIPRRSMLGIPADPTSPEVRQVIGSWGVVRARLDRVLPAFTGRDARDPYDLAWRRMGGRVAQRLVAPIASAIHGADARSLDVDVVCRGLKNAMREHGSLAAAVGSLRDGSSPVNGVAGGLHLLIEKLAEGLRIEYGRRAESLERDASGWTVRAGDATWQGDHVILAADARSMHTLLSPHDEALAATDPGVREGASVRLVTLLLTSEALDAAPVGTGMLVGANAGLRAKALTHVNHKWPTVGAAIRQAHGPHAHALRVSYGRRGQPLPEVTVADAVADASTLTGVTLHESDVIASEVTEWTMTASSTAATEFGRIAEAAAARLGIAVTGAAVAGTGLAAVVPHAHRAAAGARS